MATRPTKLRASAHHGYKSWTSTFYDDTGKRRTKRFGRVGQVSKSEAMVQFELWEKKEWFGREATRNPGKDAYTIDRLARTYHEHAKTVYLKRGKLTTHISQVASAMNALIDEYGPMTAEAVGAPEITKLMDKQITAGVRKNRPTTLSITTLNGRLRIIKQAFAWARAYGLVSREASYDISLVKPMRAGRSKATAPVPVTPVAEETIKSLLPFCPQTVADMVNVLLLTGMRAGELCGMRPCDVVKIPNAAGDVWVFRPVSHKTEHHGKDRVIVFGRQTMLILQPYIDKRKLADPVFTPMEAHSERLEMNGTAKQKAYQTSRSRFKPGRAYNTHTFRNAVQRACDRAFDPKGERGKQHDWSHRINPHQFRHNAATRLRTEFGMEAAADMLGHSSFSTTKIYAERTLDRLIEMARKAG